MHLLPEFGSGIFGDVHAVYGGVYRGVEHHGALGGAVFKVCPAADGVPVVVTRLPGQVLGEGGEHVVERPRQNDVVVTVQVEHNDSCGDPDACKHARHIQVMDYHDYNNV